MKQDYSVKDILNAVDDILKVKSNQKSKKEIANEIPVKDILNTVNNVLRVYPIQESTKKIINQVFIKNDITKKLVNNL